MVKSGLKLESELNYCSYIADAVWVKEKKRKGDSRGYREPFSIKKPSQDDREISKFMSGLGVLLCGGKSRGGACFNRKPRGTHDKTWESVSVQSF